MPYDEGVGERKARPARLAISPAPPASPIMITYAAQAYEANKAEALALLDQLRAKIEAHQPVGKITWAHAVDMLYYVDQFTDTLGLNG